MAMGKYAAVITCRTVKGEEKTAAIVYGSWAVHRSLGLELKRDEWTITNVGSGLGIPREHTYMLRKTEAIAVAKILDDELGARQVNPRVGRVIVKLIRGVLANRTSRVS